jgi:hypothetical protein
MENTMFKPTSPENEAIVLKLVDALSTIPAGKTLPYAELETHVPGCFDSSWLLVKARASAEKSLSCAFETVRGVGIKRLASEDVPSIGYSSLRRIRRASKRGVKRLTQANNSNSLSPDQHRRTVGMISMLGAVSMIADGRRASAVAAVADHTKPIPPKNILEMFRAE